MLVYTVPVTDALTTNCFFYIDEKTKHGFIIDPAAEADRLLEIIKTNDWSIEKILITHGHFDHIGAVGKLHDILGIPYFIHENGKNYLTNPEMNLSVFFQHNVTLSDAQYFQDGKTFFLQGHNEPVLTAIHTLGHTEDSVIYHNPQDKTVFAGDTIFKNSVGRTDLPGGNAEKLMNSIKTRIFTLDEDTVLYSGHTTPTTIKAEKQWF